MADARSDIPPTVARSPAPDLPLPVVLRYPRLRHYQNTLLLLVLAGYMLLNHSFMLLRLDVGGLMVPLGEGVLLLSLLTLNYRAVLAHLGAATNYQPLIGWWVIGLTYTAGGFWVFGNVALRDASHMIDSLFLLVGVQFALVPGAVDRLFRWLPWLLGLVVVYGLTYSFREWIQVFLPEVTDSYGQPVPLAKYVTTPILMIVATVWLMLSWPRSGPWWRRWAVVGPAWVVMAGALIPYQSRLLLVQTALVGLVLLLFRRDLLLRAAIVLLMVLATVAVLDVTDLPIHGRQTRQASVHLLTAHALSIVGISPDMLSGAGGSEAGNANGSGSDEEMDEQTAEQTAENAATQSALVASHDGWGWRMHLWRQFYHNWTASPLTIAFGQGFGEPLVYRPSRHFIVREPHNSYLSILGKLGIMGLALWLWFHLDMLRRWWGGYRRKRQAGAERDAMRLLAVLVFLLLLCAHGLAEDTFAKPFFMMPYYFLLGVTLGWIGLMARGRQAGDRGASRRIKSPRHNDVGLGG